MARGPVGVVGIGDMGYPIAIRMVESGLDVIVHDLRAEALERAVADGAAAAPALDGLAHCPIVSVVLVDDAQVRAVVAGPGGLFELLAPGATVIVQATVLPSTVIDLGREAAERGFRLIDAPVSGGSVRAREGGLAVMVGGDDDAVEGCLHVLEPLGTVHRLGALGNGEIMKLVNNMMFAGQKAFVYEGLRLADAYGIDEDTARGVLRTGTANSWAVEHLEHFDDLMVNHTLAGTDALWDIFAKDSWSALVSARERGLTIPILGLLTQVYAQVHKERFATISARHDA